MFNAVADAISGPPALDGELGAEALWDLPGGLGTGTDD